MKRIIYNPIFDFNECIADGEPHIFNDRLYLFGSHDESNGVVYCPLDYVAYSCPVDDRTAWRNEGVIYRKDQDPLNPEGKHFMYAPDVVCGNDGRYYLYYAIESVDAISVAVCDTPAGKYEFYGYVDYPMGIKRESLKDYPASFDPSVLNDHGRIYLAWGFSIEGNIPGMDLNEKNTKGAYLVELEEDMVTMKSAPRCVIPGVNQGKGTSFEGHEFLEAASLRKFNDLYYFIYSSQAQHELCYAVAKSITDEFIYQGLLISNAGKMSSNAPYLNNYANNHGSIVQLNETYWIFYHRHTYGKQYSRQACADRLVMNEDGTFVSAECTSQGLMNHPLPLGCYPAAIACFVYDHQEGIFLGFHPESIDVGRIEQSKIVNLRQTTVIYRYFDSFTEIILTLEDCMEQGEIQVLLHGECKLSQTIEAYQQEVHFQFDTLEQGEIALIFNFTSPVILETLTLK